MIAIWNTVLRYGKRSGAITRVINWFTTNGIGSKVAAFNGNSVVFKSNASFSGNNLKLDTNG